MPADRTESAQFSTKRPGRFGKPGRPLKDAVAERLRIYRAVSPLILTRGAGRVTMKEIARASCLSTGGVYHYFASRSAVLLYGLNPEALSRACTDAARQIARALSDEPPETALLHVFVEKNVVMLDFVRPALQAAIDFGRGELRSRLAAGLQKDADSFVAALRLLQFRPAAAEALADTLRRTILGLALDETVTAEYARQHLDRLLKDLLVTSLPPGDGAAMSRRRSIDIRSSAALH